MLYCATELSLFCHFKDFCLILLFSMCSSRFCWRWRNILCEKCICMALNLRNKKSWGFNLNVDIYRLSFHFSDNAKLPELWGIQSHLLFAITPKSTLIRSGCICKAPIYSSNWSVYDKVQNDFELHYYVSS